MIQITLPFPPSINHYWRRVGNKTIISKEGRAYRAAVEAIVQQMRLDRIEEAMGVVIVANPPDARRRDLDNLLKAPLDALQAAGVYADDSQFDSIEITRGGVERGSGSLSVAIYPHGGLSLQSGCDPIEELRNRAETLRRELNATLEAISELSQ